MAVMSDFHCHCDYSFDARGSIDDYCEAAIRRNLVELCFTTHFDLAPRHDGTLKEENFIRLDGNLVRHSVDVLQPYVDEVCAAHETYSSYGLTVRLGLEFGWFPGCEETVLELRDRYPIDYLLCGVHNIDGNYLEECLPRMSCEKLAEKYFREVIAAVGTGLFDTLAHLDYYKRHGFAFHGGKINRAHEPYIDALFETLINSDTGIEVNTSALRHGHADYYPAMSIVNAARKAGVTVRYLGSDAHRPENVGYDFEAAEAVVPPFIVDREG